VRLWRPQEADPSDLQTVAEQIRQSLTHAS
jgi:hypothetical protein